MLIQRPVMMPLGDGRTWELREECRFVSNVADTVFTVPAGTRVNGASTPRIVWWWLPPWGKYGRATVLHDWHCQVRDIPSDLAADVFLEMMEQDRVGRFKRSLMYEAVKLLGPEF